jgi:Flp pilus assembly protein TadG
MASVQDRRHPPSASGSGVPRRRHDAGQTLLEMAIVVTLLVFLTLGIIDFGRVFYAGMAIDQAARAGVQYGAQSKNKAADLTGIAQAAVNAAQDVDWKCADGTKSGTECVTATRYCQCSDGTSMDCATGDCGIEGRPQVYVQVQTEYTFKTFAPYPGIPNSINLNRTAVMRVD